MIFWVRIPDGAFLFCIIFVYEQRYFSCSVLQPQLMTTAVNQQSNQSHIAQKLIVAILWYSEE